MTANASARLNTVRLSLKFFGPRRAGARGRNSGKKVPVFGMLQRGGKVYTQVVKQLLRAEIMPIIKQKAGRDVVISVNSRPNLGCRALRDPLRYGHNPNGIVDVKCDALSRHP